MSCGPFLPADLAALEGLYEKAVRVAAMDDVYETGMLAGTTCPGIIGLRHDCDNVIHPAIEMARWESERRITSTYYILHTSPYWQDKDLLRRSVEMIAECGHEIGIHNDALTVALQTGRDAVRVLYEAVEELRGYGHTIRSTVAHGNQLCHVAKYVNDEMFDTCARPAYGEPNRWLEHNGTRVQIKPIDLGYFGLDFDANWLPRGDYLSDSGGRWSQPFDEVAAAFPSNGQLHMLVHPDWWGEAFERAEVAA